MHWCKIWVTSKGADWLLVYLFVFSGICDAVQLSIKPSGNTFLTKTNLQLRCKCYLYPLGNYTFTKDNVPVAVGGRISVSRNKLLIDNATEDDSGKYSCKAALNETSFRSSPAPLSVTVVGKCSVMSIVTIVRFNLLAGVLELQYSIVFIYLWTCVAQH